MVRRSDWPTEMFRGKKNSTNGALSAKANLRASGGFPPSNHRAAVYAILKKYKTIFTQRLALHGNFLICLVDLSCRMVLGMI